VVSLKCLWTKPPKLGSLLGVQFTSDDHVLLHENRKLAWIFTCGARPGLKLGFMLFPGFGVSDQAVTILSRAAHGFRAICGHEKRNRLGRRIVELGTDGKLALVIYWLARPKFANYVRSLDKAV